MAVEIPLWTPWLAPLRHRLTAALADLTGLPADGAWLWQHDPKATGFQVSIRVEMAGSVAQAQPDVTFGLGQPQLHRQATWQGQHLAVELRSSIPSALRSELIRRLQAIDAQGAQGPLLGQALQAWQAWRPYAGMRDEDVRTFSNGEAMLRLGFACNQNCDFCFQDRQWPAAPHEMLKLWLDEFLAQAPKRVVFSGGEPLVHGPLLLELAERCQGHQVPLWLQTNAIGLDVAKRLQSLQNAGLVGALVSYHAASAPVSDALTRAPGTHERTERGILALLRAGLRVDLNGVVDARTLPDLLQRSQRICAVFLPHCQYPGQLSVAFAFPTRDAGGGTYDAYALPLDTIAPVLNAAAVVLVDAGIAVTADGSCGFPQCTLPRWLRNQAAITDHADEHQQSREKTAICHDCVLKDQCMGPRRDYLQRFGTRGIVAQAEL